MKKLFFLFLLISNLILAQSGKEKVLVTDMTKLKQITNVTISPDGKRAVYALRSNEVNETDKLDFDYRSHLWVTDFQSVKQLTRGTESVGGASWSADSKQIAFTRNVKGKSQIFIMPLDGGEAIQLTDLKYGANNPQYSPDGNKILFSINVSFSELLKDTVLNPNKKLPSWSFEKAGFKTNDFLKADKKVKANPDGSLEEIRAYLDKDVDDKKAKVFSRLNFQGEASTEPEIRFNLLFVVDAKEAAKPQQITRSFWSFNGATWSADSKKIYAVCGRDSLQHPDREQNTAIVRMNVDGTGLQTLIAEKGISYSNPTLSPDGKSMVFTMSKIEWLGFNQTLIANADGTNVTPIVFDRAVSNFEWSDDSRFVYFAANSNGGIPLYRLDFTTKKVEKLSDYDSGISSFDISKDRIIYAKTEVKNPSELYSSDLLMKNSIKLSSHNDNLLKNKALSFPEKHIYVNSKGQNVEYWIMKPANFEADKKYPLLLNMHGGPTAMWGPGENSMWHEFQYFCSQGYGVVYANPRGSGGYGKDFQFANYQDWGTGPAEDVLAAATNATKESWVDTARQVITGGSYAGYLTAWIVGHDNRFKAAFAQRGVYELTTFMGEGNAWRLTPNYFGGYPWEAKTKDILDRESPYSYIDKIKTPLLIKHGENDLRTGVIQSEMMYKSLKILGKEVEYVRMPGATHELSRAGNVRQKIDRMLRIYEFFERYIF
ncbi:dipeptidyl aminopeptidase/acylaminoacyl peptidase [Arcicella aurantiaca]|uniref:Dipeptidyl aminopeptidase/acylaminoacyl peptidase n=1 Tax=Arcicella aurantiaca TaxID=591202 RepID=A0A316EEX7_9BACT|nr:S9 family peptidase [Arcicella aurantiaca]PWK28630.1 dipeptidyl aminopeptidase/acylaminoacyl peptidase [Arcicella aurantiaca]